MLPDAVANLCGEIQPFPVLLQNVHHPQALPDMAKASGHQFIENPLAGMTEGGMAEIVP
jgi:hypothetical protein